MRRPPNTPEKGDTCKRRGFIDFTTGVVLTVDGEGGSWCRVKWEHLADPMMCHLNELEKC